MSEDSWYNYLFPGPIKASKSTASKKWEVPPFLNPFAVGNAAIPLNYFEVGIAIYFLSTPISIYLINYQNISSTQYNAYSTLVSLPWSLKFLFGMLTDGVPVFGYRRKPWQAVGWFIYIGISFYMCTLSEPGFTTITVSMFFMTCGYLLADVCADSLCVERARHENVIIKGSLQTSAYTIRSYGCTLGALMGALLYNTPNWGWGLTISQLFFMSGILPVLGVVLLYWFLNELAATCAAPSFCEQIWSIWTTLQLRAVWLPVSFMYTYSMFQIPNAAWTNFLVVGLDFSDFEIGMLAVAGALLYWIGMIIYKEFFFETSWRMIYVYTTVLGALFSLSQVILILRWNVAMGIPDFYFALGDSSVAVLISAIQLMPGCIMFIMLCPDGCEGLTYALLTTITNLASTVASDIGSALTLIWDVSNSSLEEGDFTGMLYLTILTSCLQVFPLVFIYILPDSKKQQQELLDAKVSNWWAGFTLTTVIVVSLFLTIGLNIYFIWY